MLRTLASLCRAALRWAGLAADFDRLTFSEAEVPWIAVVLQRTAPCLTHSGIAYRQHQGSAVRVLHFAAHLMLCDDPGVTSRYVFAVPELKEEDQEYLAGFCRRIARANAAGVIPYSFTYDPDLLFDQATGRLVTSDVGQGLTCSTFVAAVFRSAGHTLVRLQTWPGQADAEDIHSREEMLHLWRNSGRPNLIARASEIEPSIRARRVRPEHVAGACLIRERRRPVSYRCCKAVGIKILANWDQQYSAPSSR